MQITLNPGYVYIFCSTTQRNMVKIGLATDVDRREFDLSLADPTAKLHACQFFLDARGAEKHLHNQFAAQRVKREHYRVTKAVALEALNALAAARQAERTAFENACRWMADVGELKLDRSADVSQCDGSALSVLFSHVPNKKDGRNVQNLIPVALLGGASGEQAFKALSGIGLLPYVIDGIVLFDKSDNTKLERVFKGQPCAKTWREQLAKFAGIKDNGKPEGINQWLERTQSGYEIVDRVNPSF